MHEPFLLKGKNRIGRHQPRFRKSAKRDIDEKDAISNYTTCE